MALYIDNKYARLISSRLRNFRQRKENLYNFSCPFCGDSKTNQYKARGYLYDKSGSLFFTCHNCGHYTNLSGLLGHLDSSMQKEYAMEVYMDTHDVPKKNTKKVSEASLRKKAVKATPKFATKNPQKRPLYEHAEYLNNLPADHPANQYVNSRMIPKKFYEILMFTDNFKKFVETIFPETDKELLEEPRLVIPIHNASGELIGANCRVLGNSDVRSRYMTVRLNASKERLMFGANRLEHSKPIFILEGAFDSMFFDNGVASGDSNLRISANELCKLGYEKSNMILISDYQPRNKQIVSAISKSIKDGFLVCLLPDTIAGKDINEWVVSGTPIEDIKKLIIEHSYEGLRAELELTKWKKVN